MTQLHAGGDEKKKKDTVVGSAAGRLGRVYVGAVSPGIKGERKKKKTSELGFPMPRSTTITSLYSHPEAGGEGGEKENSDISKPFLLPINNRGRKRERRPVPARIQA